MRKFMHKFMTAAVMAITFAFAGHANEDAPVFLEGFPDVPLVEGVSEVEDERVVFDTPGGTVAQATLESTIGFQKALEGFASALTALGWDCSPVEAGLGCSRDESRLAFNADPNAQSGTRIILRLEPNE